MNIKECYNLPMIVRELEAVFQIDGQDFEEKDISILLSNVRTRILRQYQVDLNNKKIDDPELSVEPNRGATVLFIQNVMRMHSKLCGYGHIARYLTSISLSLSDIGYLGFTAESMVTTLIILQRESTLPKADDAIKAIEGKLQTVSTSLEKRIFVLIVVAYELGFYEVSSVLAELLYLSEVR